MKHLLFIFCAFCYLNASAQTKFDKHPTVVAALDLLKSFTKEQKKTAHFSFEDTLRTTWSNLPIGQFNRKGLWLKDMNDTQRQLVHILLRTVLSSDGYKKALFIMQYDQGINQRLTTAGNTELAKIYGEEKYFTSIFGEPSENDTWSFRFEGHHLSLNFTFTPMGISCTPMFTGINPAVTTIGIRAGQYVLLEENEIGCGLYKSLSIPLQAKALIGEHPKDADVMTRTGKEDFLKTAQGVAYKEFNAEQKTMVHNMLRAWVENLEEHLAKEKLQFIEKNLNKSTFAWMGTKKTTDLHYFRIYSPEFVVEFTNRDGGIFHYHTLWRNLGEEK